MDWIFCPFVSVSPGQLKKPTSLYQLFYVLLYFILMLSNAHILCSPFTGYLSFLINVSSFSSGFFCGEVGCEKQN